MNRHFQRRRRNSGFTLVEILVAMIILAVGLLGLAALQSSGLRYNHSAFLRTQATTLAYGILDRMRANRNEALTSNGYVTNIGTPGPSSTNCAQATADCTPSQLAAFDLNEWKDEVAAALPSGDGAISYVGTGTQSRIYSITVEWKDWRDQSGGTKQQITQSQIIKAQL